MLVKCQHEMSTKNKICKSVMYHKIAGAIALVFAVKVMSRMLT